MKKLTVLENSLQKKKKQFDNKLQNDALRNLKESIEKTERAIEIEKKKKECGNLRSLGVVKTIRELKEVIKDYPDETSFGFRNQPMQELYEVKYPDALFVVFDNLTK